MFEAACSTRIQQFDDSDESEDEDTVNTWTSKEISFTSPMDQNRLHPLTRSLIHTLTLTLTLYTVVVVMMKMA